MALHVIIVKRMGVFRSDYLLDGQPIKLPSDVGLRHGGFRGTVHRRIQFADRGKDL